MTAPVQTQAVRGPKKVPFGPHISYPMQGKV